MEFRKPENDVEYEINFAPIKPLMNDTQAYYESSRCLFCFDAPCIQACPTKIDIPLFIRQINTGNNFGSAETIYASNYFGYVCGKVCPTEVLCEGSCVYINQGVKPIEIGRLQSYATDKAIKTNKKLFRTGKPTGKKVAVIGAGPSGISCACELRMFGHDVDIYEAREYPSGLTIYGVAPYKITDDEAIAEMNYLQEQFGYNVKYNYPVRSKEEIQNLEKNYDAVFIGIGLGKTTDINLPGEDLANCYGAVEFIENLRRNKSKISIGRRVVVLGGGNTAMDAASESARLGADEVFLVYRRDKLNMSAYDFEYDLAKNVGVQGIFNAAPLEISGNGKVSAVKFIRTRDSESGIENIPGSEFTIECDMVIKATGQAKQVDFLKQIENISLDKKGKLNINSETYQTSNPKFFAAGDAVNGGAEIVNAAAEARLAAKGIHKFLTS
jgi:glutamate synthase (NADPH/NADH) small chain